MADQFALSLDATPPGTHRQRGVNSLQRLFRGHFAEFVKRLGKFRLERITKAVERFIGCGDCRKGFARIQCINPRCKAEYLRPLAGSRAEPCGRPFSCRVFHLCPSCSQKRTLLLGEYMNERLAKSMVEWEHSGFSVDGSVHLAAGSAKAREALAQYFPRHRGRSSALACAAPPSEPDWRISRTRLSSQRLPSSGLTEGRMGFGHREKPLCRKERVRPALVVDASLPPVPAASSTQDSA